MPDTILPDRALPGLFQRRRWQLAAVAGLLALAALLGFLARGTASTAITDKLLPANMPLPAHATLTRAEHFVVDRTFNWYYTVPQMDDDTTAAYYQAQLPRQGWRCVTAMKSINMTLYGHSFTASNIYITALGGGTKLQLSIAGGDYGAYLLEDDVPDGAVGLKIALEPIGDATCPGGSGK